MCDLRIWNYDMQTQTPTSTAEYPYHLTWPATLPAVCTIGGQWQRTATGEIEAWYTAEQLRLCVTAMERTMNRSIQ